MSDPRRWGAPERYLFLWGEGVGGLHVPSFVDFPHVDVPLPPNI